MRQERPYTYLSTTRGMCPECGRCVPSRVGAEGTKVWQQPLCPSCRPAPALIAADDGWYRVRAPMPMAQPSPLPKPLPVVHGCPDDCGPCEFHIGPCSHVLLPVSAASERDVRQSIDRVVEITGGVDELTLVDDERTGATDLPGLLAGCRRPQVGRVALCAGPRRLAGDSGLCERLGSEGAGAVLRLGDGTSDECRAALAELQSCRVQTALLRELRSGEREQDTALPLRLAGEHDCVAEVLYEIVARCGDRGGTRNALDHLTLDAAERMVAGLSAGWVEAAPFGPRPSAHPRCWSTAYYVRRRDEWRPWGGDGTDSGRRLTVSIHAPMDRAALDVARLVACSHMTADAGGCLVPACLAAIRAAASEGGTKVACLS